MPLIVLAALIVTKVQPLSAQIEPQVPALLQPDFLLSVGDIVDHARWQEGETVIGASGETMISDRSRTQYDLLYVPRVVEGRALTPGDRVQFFRLDRRIDDPVTREPLGMLLLPTGIGKVDGLAGETARVRVTHAFHPIVVGDRVRIVTEVGAGWPAAISVGGAPGGRVVAFQEEKAIHPPFDRLFLRPEIGGSTAPGQAVELYRPGPVRESARLPDTVLGRAMVVRGEGPIVAAVTYRLEQAELAPGDRYRVVSRPGD
jgi:hypothetical protein